MTQQSNGLTDTGIDPGASDSANETIDLDGGIFIGDDAESVNTQKAAVDDQDEHSSLLYRLVIKADGILETELGGGIPAGSVTLVESSPAVGKSVLCQHLTYAALEAGNHVAYLTSKLTLTSFVAQMASIDLGISDHLGAEKLCIYPIAKPVSADDAANKLARLASNIDHLATRHNVIIVDAITDIADRSQEDAIMRFITACHALNIKGRVIIIVAESSGFNEKTLDNFSSQCDIHISLRGAKLGSKQVNTIEVIKARNEKLDGSNILRLEVRPDSGMRILPMPTEKHSINTISEA